MTGMWVEMVGREPWRFRSEHGEFEAFPDELGDGPPPPVAAFFEERGYLDVRRRRVVVGIGDPTVEHFADVELGGAHGHTGCIQLPLRHPLSGLRLATKRQGDLRWGYSWTWLSRRRKGGTSRQSNAEMTNGFVSALPTLLTSKRLCEPSLFRATTC